MTTNRLCYISRNYYNLTSAGNKAKTDYEHILQSMGGINLGLPCKINSNKVLAFFYNAISVVLACIQMKKHDTIVLQYPVKKYFSFICNIAHIKGAKTISLIHDLGCCRRRKLTIPQEIKRLGHTDYVIATNEVMKDWLQDQGLNKPMGALGFHDYLSPSKPHQHEVPEKGEWDIVYAGSLNLRKNAFILQMRDIDYNFRFHLYGNMTDYNALAEDKHIIWQGFSPADQFIAQVKGNFGLVWDGDSLDECHGDFGSYLKFNTPHKASFYLRAGLPLIVWKHSAIANLVEEKGLGFSINSLRELPTYLKQISPQEYKEMLARVSKFATAINQGENLKQALLLAKL